MKKHALLIGAAGLIGIIGSVMLWRSTGPSKKNVPQAVAPAAPPVAPDIPPNKPKPSPARAEIVGWLKNGSATYPEATPPIKWNSNENVLWWSEVGHGYSSPIVNGNRVIVASEPDTVISVDIQNGKHQWSTQLPPSSLPEDQKDKVLPMPGEAGNTAATPSSDGERVYVVFAIGIVAALDIKTGKVAWTQVIGSDRTTGDGRSGSPVRIGDLLIVHLSELYAFEAATGKIRWKQQDAEDAYGTPVATTINDEDVLLLPKGMVVRVSDGKILTTLNASLQFSSPRVFGRKACYMDHSFSIFELPDKILDSKQQVTEYWTGSIAEDVYTTPLFHEGYLYTITQSGKLIILDLMNKIKIEKQFELQENVYPSPVLAGKYIYFGDDKGKTIIIEPGKEANVVGINELSEGSGGTPAFSGNKIFIRSGELLYCMGK